jgi:predicted RNA-binding Zn ribbon-like protein
LFSIHPACCNGIVHYNPYGKAAVHLGASLANEPPTSVNELCRRCDEAGMLLECEPTAADVAALTNYLQRWVLIADAVDYGQRADLVNALLAEYAAAPRLTNHDDSGWHLHFRADGLRASRQISALITVGTALHLSGRGMDRLGRCETEGCSQIYADTSRNGRQRFCSPGCANRAAVRRHRVKTKAS